MNNFDFSLYDNEDTESKFIPSSKLQKKDEKTSEFDKPFNFDTYDSSEPNADNIAEKPEGFLKSAARTALQVPQGLLEATTYGITTGLGSLLGQGELNDPEEIERIRAASERVGKPFDEEAYEQAGQQAISNYPTIGNIARKIEEKTGIPLEPKTKLQKSLRFGSMAAKAIPGKSPQAPKGYGFRGSNTGLPRPVLGAGVSGISRLLQEAGIPEPFADVLSFGSIKQIPPGGSSINVGKAKKESGLTTRPYESLERPIEVPEKKINKLNQKIETEFKDISDKIIKESPVAEIHEGLENDAAFKQNVENEFKRVQELSESIPNEFSTSIIKDKLNDIIKKKSNSSLTPSEFDKAHESFLKKFIKETPEKNFRAKEIVEQFRSNNKQLKEAYEPGQSFAYNRAKREALLDYNIALSEMIQKEFPNSEFSNLFKETNKNWSDINSVETITNFIDDLFDGKINFKKGRDLFNKPGMDVPFKKALGEKGFADFKTLMNDLLSTEQGSKLLRAAESSGFPDVAKTATAYVFHPTAAKAKVGYNIAKGTYRYLRDAILLNPKLSITWDKGINAMKAGDYKAAGREFKILDKAVESQRVDALKNFNEKKSSKDLGFKEAFGSLAGGGATIQLYENIFEALKKGKETVAGITDPILKAAKPAYDAGQIKSVDDLKKFADFYYKNKPKSNP